MRPPTVPGLGERVRPGRGPLGPYFSFDKTRQVVIIPGPSQKSDSPPLTPFYLATPTSTHLRHHLKFFSPFIDPTPCCRVSSSPVLPVPTSPDSPPLAGVDDSNLRPLIVNVPVICFMKKILLTSVLVVAAVISVHAQGTVYFPNTGSTNFTGLSFNTFSGNLPGDIQYTQAKLYIGTVGFNYGSGPVNLSSFTLSGQGITGTASLTGNLFVGANLTSTTNLFSGGWSQTGAINLDTPLTTWNSSTSLAAFSYNTVGAVAPPGAQILYAVQYADSGGTQINSAFGNINLVAVPEPSTYVAAAGLLGLCLWSARRQLFKLAGFRSTSSGAGSNGAA